MKNCFPFPAESKISSDGDDAPNNDNLHSSPLASTELGVHLLSSFTALKAHKRLSSLFKHSPPLGVIEAGAAFPAPELSACDPCSPACGPGRVCCAGHSSNGQVINPSQPLSKAAGMIIKPKCHISFLSLCLCHMLKKKK